MKVCYFDCYSGVAGDMILGAMVSAGLPLKHLKKELKKLPLKGYEIRAVKEEKGIFAGTNVHVETDEEAHPRRSFIRYTEIAKLINSSRLSADVKRLSLSIFDCLARAEARVHRSKVSDVHFHELGAVDSIVDIVGASIGFEWFDFERVYSSPLPVTRGIVRCSHGRICVPAPVTLEILKGVPLEPSPVKGEIVTPTGAAILKTVASGFGGNPIRMIDKIGYGYGDFSFGDIPNALRLIVGDGHPLYMIEANIDDMNPKFYEYVIEKLMKEGAVDVVFEQAWMKKKRPGVLLKVLCEIEKRRRLIDIILRETTTLGVRSFPVEREVLERKEVKVKIGAEFVRVKVGMKDGIVLNVEPEYEDLKRVAIRKNVPLKNIYQHAVAGARRQLFARGVSAGDKH